MIIADLNHFEIVTEKAQIVGANKRFALYPSAIATALADAQAVGTFTLTNSNTLTQAAAGVFSRSIAVSSSIAVG